MRLLTTVLCLAAVGSAVASRLLGTWFGYVPVETDPGYVRAMRLFGLRLWRGSAPFPMTGEHLSERRGKEHKEHPAHNLHREQAERQRRPHQAAKPAFREGSKDSAGGGGPKGGCVRVEAGPSEPAPRSEMGFGGLAQQEQRGQFVANSRWWVVVRANRNNMVVDETRPRRRAQRAEPGGIAGWKQARTRPTALEPRADARMHENTHHNFLETL